MEKGIYEYDHETYHKQIYKCNGVFGHKIKVEVGLPEMEYIDISLSSKFRILLDDTYLYLPRREMTLLLDPFLYDADKYLSEFFDWLKSNSDKSDAEVIAYTIAIFYKVFRNSLNDKEQKEYSYVIDELNNKLPNRIKALVLLYEM